MLSWRHFVMEWFTAVWKIRPILLELTAEHNGDALGPYITWYKRRNEQQINFFKTICSSTRTKPLPLVKYLLQDSTQRFDSYSSLANLLVNDVY